jgi:hypothetical protein
MAFVRAMLCALELEASALFRGLSSETRIETRAMNRTFLEAEAVLMQQSAL